MNSPVFSTSETGKYPSEQAAINLPKSKSTIYFQFNIPKDALQGSLQGINISLHMALAVSDNTELLPSNHTWVTATLKWKTSVFTQTEKANHAF